MCYRLITRWTVPGFVSGSCMILTGHPLLAAKPPDPPTYVAKIDTSKALGTFTPRNNADTLVVLIHGWNSDRTIWAQGKIDITSRSVFRTDVWDYDWSADSSVVNPFSLVAPSSAHGQYIAYQALSKGNYKHVQLVSHSAGAYANEFAARIIRKALPNTTVQQTFLDAFLPGKIENMLGIAGTSADNYYFREQLNLPIYGNAEFLLHTQVDIPRAANYDLTPINPNPKGVLDIAADHGYPYRWYQGSVKGKLNEASPKSAYDEFGYGFSKQVADGADNLPNFPKAWPPAAFTADKGKSKVTKFDAQNNTISFSATKNLPAPKPQKDFINALSANDVVETGGGGTVALAEPTPGDLRIRLSDPSPSQSDFAYAEINLETTPFLPDTINFLEFDYRFDEPPEDGMLHVFINNEDNSGWNELAAYNAEFVSTPGEFESSTPIWLNDLLPGQYTLAFRYDSLGGDSGVNLQNFNFGNLSVVPEPTFAFMAATILLIIQRRSRRMVTNPTFTSRLEERA